MKQAVFTSPPVITKRYFWINCLTNMFYVTNYFPTAHTCWIKPLKIIK